jgi:epoxyqueuosine reductase QueG
MKPLIDRAEFIGKLEYWGASIGVNTTSHYSSRSEAIDLKKCVHQVRDVFGKLPDVAPLICGICIKVCPWGKPTKKTELRNKA